MMKGMSKMKKDCSKIIDFYAEYQRMCSKENGLACSKCPLSSNNNGEDLGCVAFIKVYTDKAVSIVQKWSDEHEQKTYMEDFFEKFPNAVRDRYGTPKSCWKDIYGDDTCDYDYGYCDNCWRRPMEEENKENG